MIDFACKQFKLDEVVKCGLGMTKADMVVFKFLVANLTEEFTTEELSKKLGLNLTTIQRAVKKLHEAEVLHRTQKNLEGGGYLFYYHSKGKKKIKEIVMSIISKWVGKVDEEFLNW